MKENTLFTFGCSYTQDFNDNTIKNYQDYFNYRGGNFPPSWPEILSKKLGLNNSNYGLGGTGNDVIFTQICKHITEIKKGDVVIIGWTYIHRYRWAIDFSNKWCNLGAGLLNNGDPIMKSTHEEIISNRLHPLYIKEVYDKMNLIDHISNVVGFDVYYWSSDIDIIYEKPYKLRNDKKFLLTDKIKINNVNNDDLFQIIFKMGGEDICKETKGVVIDNHLGELGHKIQADLFYNHITNYKLTQRII